MSKFKKGDHVLRKQVYDKVYCVSETKEHIHEAFTGEYMYLEGEDELFNQDDFVHNSSFEQYLGYGISGCMGLLFTIVMVVTLYCLWSWLK